MTADMTTSIKASRLRVPRSRGALSGFLLVILGAWAALIPFIGPAFNLAYTPMADTSWHWTSERGWLEVLPGVVAVLGGLMLLRSTSRLVTSLGAWIAAAAGAWLLVGPTLAPVLNINHEIPDPHHGEKLQALDSLLFFYAIGAAVLFFAALALGRVTVQSVRDVRAAERRAAAAAEEERLAEERRIADDQRRDDQRRDEAVAAGGPEGRDGAYDDTGRHDRVVAGEGAAVGAGAAGAAAVGRHEHNKHERERETDQRGYDERDGQQGDGQRSDGQRSDAQRGDGQRGFGRDGERVGPEGTQTLPPVEQGRPMQGQPYQGQPNQGQPNQGQPNQGQPNQGQPNQGQPNQGQPNQGQEYRGQEYRGQEYPPPASTDVPPSEYPPAEHTRR